MNTECPHVGPEAIKKHMRDAFPLSMKLGVILDTHTDELCPITVVYALTRIVAILISEVVTEPDPEREREMLLNFKTLIELELNHLRAGE